MLDVRGASRTRPNRFKRLLHSANLVCANFDIVYSARTAEVSFDAVNDDLLPGRARGVSTTIGRSELPRGAREG